LPLTLAILPACWPRSRRRLRYPVETVSEIVSVKKEEITPRAWARKPPSSRRVISVVQLDHIFQWKQSANAAQNQSGRQTLVIVSSDGREIGLVVDKLIGEEDVVIKSLAENYRNVDGVAGASILGDGRVSLILDVGALVLGRH